MSFIDDSVLQRIIEEGFTSQEIKEAVFEMLSPYFENKDILEENSLNSQMLSVFTYLMLYNGNSFFSDSLAKVLSIYRTALMKNEEKFFHVLHYYYDRFSNMEKLMWNVKRDTPKSISSDIYDATTEYMKHIGNTLEIGCKLELLEFYSFIKIANEETLDCEKNDNLSFGVIIQNILDKDLIDDILVTSPITLKLSDWRNIAYHHSYKIVGDNIICTYGKTSKTFNLSVEDLEQYTADIIMRVNTIDLARRIVLFDNMEKINENLSFHNNKKNDERLVMKIGQMKTALLTQGFLVADYLDEHDMSSLFIHDLSNSGELGREELVTRRIHASQFLPKLWYIHPKKVIRIIYCNADGVEELISEIEGEVCKKVVENNLSLSYIANHINFKLL